VAAAALGTGSVCSGSDEDFLYWTKATFLIPVWDDWQFGFQQKLAFEDEARRLDHQQRDYGLIYSGLADWIKLFGAVKVTHAKTDDRRDWTVEIRPHLNIGIRSKLCGLDMINRSRIEYRDIEDENTTWRFRHKVLFVSPATFTSWRLQPFIGDELFYSFNSRRFSGQRLCTGLYVPLAETIRLELFYFWHLYEDEGHWHDANILGSYVRFTF